MNFNIGSDGNDNWLGVLRRHRIKAARENDRKEEAAQEKSKNSTRRGFYGKDNAHERSSKAVKDQ